MSRREFIGEGDLVLRMRERARQRRLAEQAMRDIRAALIEDEQLAAAPRQGVA